MAEARRMKRAAADRRRCRAMAAGCRQRRWPRWRTRRRRGRRPRRPRAPLVQPTIRTKFADTALWVGALDDRQGRHGRGRARHAREPDHLADQGLGHGPRHPVGEGFADVVTRKDLIVRLEAPRFFVQTDEVVLSAIVHNYLKTKKKVEVQLELGRNCLRSPKSTQRRRMVRCQTRGQVARAQSSRSRPTARPASIGGSRSSTRARR